MDSGLKWSLCCRRPSTCILEESGSHFVYVRNWEGELPMVFACKPFVIQSMSEDSNTDCLDPSPV